METEIQPRTTTISRSEIPKSLYALTIMWALYGVFVAIMSYVNFAAGDGVAWVFVVLSVFSVLLAWVTWHGGLWKVWSEKHQENLREDLLESFSYWNDTAKFNATLYRTKDRSLPSGFEWFFKFDKSLISK